MRFDVLIGRTAYEVIQVRSILYPYGVRVVRTITIQRKDSGPVRVIGANVAKLAQL